jgi:large subunit ribosomal protein L29
MAREKKKNWRGMADEDLGKELAGLTKALFTLRTQTVTSEVENKALFRKHRRDIARIKTEIRARELKTPASPSAKVAGDKPAAPAAKKS